MQTERTEEQASAAISQRQIARIISPRRQELILLPTERCNLRCTYCYEDFAIGKMSEETQQGLESLITRRVSGLDVLQFSWFGGEPLVAKDVVLRLSRFAHRLCAAEGVQFRGGLTTNGYLLDKQTFEDLVECQQDFYQITLDGWKGTHDAVRRFADGRGSFERIWSNLLAIRKTSHPCEILLRIHVRRDNIETLPELMAELGREFGADDRFRLDFEHVRDMGGEGGKTVLNPVRIGELKAIEGPLRAAFATAAGIASPQVAAQEERDDALLEQKLSGESAGGQRASDIAAGAPYICYAAKPNSLLVRANGRIGKCTVALYDERNDIGRLKADGSIEIFQDKFRTWIRGVETLDLDTLGCPLQGMAH